jgi:hypothetical protein
MWHFRLVVPILSKKSVSFPEKLVGSSAYLTEGGGQLKKPKPSAIAVEIHAVINYLLEVFSKDDFLHVSLKKLQPYVA